MTAHPILPLSAPPKDAGAECTTKIEDFRSGYPRFTALISSHSPFFVFRRFSRIRARLLLLKQDRLSVLEQKLDQIDQSETSPLFLGKSRIDGNGDRLAVLAEMESCLIDYDDFVERTARTLRFGAAETRDAQSLKNWVEGNGCVARDERSYLAHNRDLFSLAPSADSAVTRFENWIEDRLAQSFSHFRTNQTLGHVSSDQHVFIYSGSLIRRIAKALLICLVTLLLLLPIVICNLLTTVAARIIIVMLSTIFYLLVLSGLTGAKTTELVVAGTTYATVLIVFVSGTSGDGT